MEEELDKALRGVWDNENFVYCVTKILPTDDNKAEMVNAIHNGWVKNSSEVIVYALAIYHDEDYEAFE